MLDIVRMEWSLDSVDVASWHHTVATRAVAHVITSQGELAVKVDARPHPSVIGGERVQAHVNKHRPVLAPELIPSNSGALTVTQAGVRYAVSRWIDGSTAHADVAAWERIGEALAELHSLPPVERAFAIPWRVRARNCWPSMLGQHGLSVRWSNVFARWILLR